MCGVFGYVTDRDAALGPILIEAAQRLTYRGYDSVGAATFRDGTIDLRKDVGKVDAVAARHGFAEMRGTRGITQLRWATFGEPSQVNAQPHLDSDGLMVGAHNGNVVNNAELRVQFLAEGMTVRSDNDGESCVHAVERYVRQGHELVYEAIRLAYGDPGGRLRVRDRARGRRPAVCLQEAVRPRRRDRRGLHLRLVGPALAAAADAERDPAARRGDRDAVGGPGRGAFRGGRQPGRPSGRGRHGVLIAHALRKYWAF